VSLLPEQATASKPLMLVTWFGTGAIALPGGQDWKLELLRVYDKDTRPVAQYSKSDASLTASFILFLFENLSGKPTAQGCREDGINPILEHDAQLISKRVEAR
jgi:hypothetical protein